MRQITGYIFILVSMLMLPLSTQARETLFQSGYELAGFGGPEFLYTKLKGQNTMIVGGKGSGLWGNDLYAFSLGVAGFATPGQLELDANNSFNLAYGGMTIGYDKKPSNLIHWNTDALLGAGQVWVTDSSSSIVNTSSTILVLELSASSDINLTNHLQMGLGVSWRIISNPLKIDEITGKDLSGLALKLSIEFGRFE